jgi:DNA-binding transcriptional MerR regulator
MASQSFRVGELARRTGVTVRTLHHYDELGLLSPARRTRAGHRLYGEADVVKLLRIRALVQLGCPLADVAALLRRRDFAPVRVLELQLERLRGQLAQTQRLCQRLESLLQRLRGDGEVPIGEFLETIEAMTMFEKYYTQEQLHQLSQRGAQLGDDQIRAVQDEWPRLIAAMRAEMDKGSDPRSPAVQPLAARWRELLELFTGGDAGIRKAAATAIRSEPRLQQQMQQTGLDARLCEFVGRALAP